MEDLSLEKLEEEETEDTIIVTHRATDDDTIQPDPTERCLRRKRKNSDDLMHMTKNRAIKKRKSDTSVELKTEKDVRKYYLNINKNVKVKPVLLETIFERDESLEEDTQHNAKDLGRATKRTLNICDGFNINKSLIKKRKNLIKKNWGSRKKPRKVALKKFKEDFQKKMELDGMSSE